MLDKKEKNSLSAPEEEPEKILFGEKSAFCFACGAKINPGLKECPNCKTKQS